MKKVKVIWSEEALNDLDTIFDFLKIKSFSAAQAVVESILSRTKQLEHFPESGSLEKTISSFLKKEYRYIVEGHYKIIYSLEDTNGVVYIHTIFDTRQNPEKLQR